MRRKMFLALAVATIIPILLVLTVTYAQAVGPESNPTQGLVPAGCQTGCPCQLCQLYQTARLLIDFALYYLAIPITAVMILAGGVTLLTSAGNPEKLTTGKKTITNAIIGLALAFFAWVIINTLLATLTFEITFKDAAGSLWNKIPCNTTEQSECKEAQ